ncbi:MAG: radical SAM protein [archaeon]
MSKHPIQDKEKLPKNYTIYDFQDNWNKKSIKKAINNSKNKIPSFSLSKIEIHPAGTCNQSCKMCYGKLLAPKKRVNLSAKDINSLLLDIRKNMPNENPLIILSGLYSEPLTNPKIKEILKYIGGYNFRFGLYTNGLLMDDEIIGLLIKNSLNSKKEDSFVSFNITSSLLSGDFEKLIKIIKKLSTKRKSESGLQINAPILIVKPNYKFFKSIIKN